jgi:hypothetical protein
VAKAPTIAELLVAIAEAADWQTQASSFERADQSAEWPFKVDVSAYSHQFSRAQDRRQPGALANQEPPGRWLSRQVADGPADWRTAQRDQAGLYVGQPSDTARLGFAPLESGMSPTTIRARIGWPSAILSIAVRWTIGASWLPADEILI